MIIYGITNNGIEIKLDNLLSLNINIEENVPADDLSAVFACEFTYDFVYFKIFVNDSLFFFGVVDEQITVYLDKYIHTKFLVRSLAALLLDNEALPQSYLNPDDTTIFNRHVNIVGITKFSNDKSLSNGKVDVSKGQNQWNVVYNFCRICLNSFPEVSTNGTLLMGGYSPSKIINFGKNSNFPINYAHISKKQHKLISEVFVKTNYNDDYSYNLINPFASNLGVVRQRYINATDTSSYSVDTAIKIIDKSNKDFFNITIKSPVFLADSIGQNASLLINNSFYDNMYIYKIIYNYYQGTQNTTLFLKYSV